MSDYTPKYPPKSSGGSLVIQWGAWGGFYVNRGYMKRVCLGWVAITYCPFDLDDMWRDTMFRIKELEQMVDDNE